MGYVVNLAPAGILVRRFQKVRKIKFLDGSDIGSRRTNFLRINVSGLTFSPQTEQQISVFFRRRRLGLWKAEEPSPLSFNDVA